MKIKILTSDRPGLIAGFIVDAVVNSNENRAVLFDNKDEMHSLGCFEFDIVKEQKIASGVISHEYSDVTHIPPNCDMNNLMKQYIEDLRKIARLI